MNYKEMYENAIKRAKAALEIAANKEEAEGYVSTIFPELKESEGEKIRKELIEHCKNQAKPYIDTGNECPQIQSWIDWLEKQGEQHCNVSPIDDFATEFEKQVSYIIASSINKENDYTADYVRWAANALLNYAKKELEKQGANSVSVTKGNTSVTNAEVVSHPTVSTIIEPKFKVGDWIVQNGLGTYKIVEVCESWYEVISYNDGIQYSIGFDKENDCHLWTIQDAKDGDVLFAGDWVCIFRSFNINGFPKCYCHYDLTLEEFKVDTDSYMACGGDIYPATKEQRDLLFAKMHESGYEWDAEKKELRKIGQKFTDKVEPKFHEGDWVVTRYDKVNQVIAVDEDGDGFTLDDDTYFSGSWKDSYHLWTIQDAKDGDVLATEDENLTTPFIAIYKSLGGTGYYGLKDDLTFNSHCFIGFDGIFYKGEQGHVVEGAHPATKEQRDLLFSKMKEAGYVWDSEKKELKKIHVIDEGKSEMDYCFTKMMNGEKVGPTWSEEDEDIIQALNACIDEAIKSGLNYISFDSKSILIGKVKSWLKSLKPQNTWKPSDEQMADLYTMVCECRSADHQLLQDLYYGLKTLRGE